MVTYIMLANWTDQGVRNMKESPRRLDAAKKALRDMGGDFKCVYLTMGDYDLVAIYEASDDAVAARFTMQLGMLGNIRTRTLKAFPEAAYREIVASSANVNRRPLPGRFRSRRRNDSCNWLSSGFRAEGPPGLCGALLNLRLGDAFKCETGFDDR